MNLQQPAPKLEGEIDPERNGATFDVGEGIGLVLASVVSAQMSDGDVRSLPIGDRAELLAHGWRLLGLLPSPSAARDLALAIVEILERGATETGLTAAR